MYDDLSVKQLAILQYIKSEIVSKGYPPSVRDICVGVGFKSTSTVHGHLNTLEKLGYIRKDPTRPRAIEVLDGKTSDSAFGFEQDTINLPVIEKLNSKSNILSQSNAKDYIPLPLHMVNGPNSFLIKVKDDSLINKGILTGDYLIVEEKKNADNSELVLALVKGKGASVRVFSKEGNFVKLKPENDSISPVILDERLVEILGVVTGMFRML
ncbi:MAG: transcriptional repressor LexA [Clostridioides sp.]|jgi:repressor LexA|nr:transcriptional repressor LexA [Clostridioides sp.]